MKAFLIIVAMLASFMACNAQEEQQKHYDFEYEGIKYKVISEEERTVETVRNENTTSNVVNDPYILPEDSFKLPEKVYFNDTEYSLVRIGEYSFANTAPKKFILPLSVNEIKFDAFCQAKVEEFVGLDSVSIISGHAFSGSNIREFVFPDRVTRVNILVFMLCHKLRRIVFHNNINQISQETLATINPYELKCEASIPPELFGYGFFGEGSDNKHLKNTWLVVPAQSLQKYITDNKWGRIFDGKILPDNYALDSPVLFESDGLFFSKIADTDSLVAIVRPPKQFMEHPYGYGVGGKFTVPSTVEFKGKRYTVHTIGGFMGSEYEEIVLPRSVKVIDRLTFLHSKIKRINTENISEIRHQAFHGSDLTEIKLPEGINISTDASFYDCRNLVKADFPATITLITGGNLDALQNKLFANCINLNDLICRSPEPFKTPYGGYDPIFSGINNNGDIYIHISPTVWVPKGSIDAYREAWGKYTDDFRELEEEPVKLDVITANHTATVRTSAGEVYISDVEGKRLTITSVSGAILYHTNNAPEELNLQLPRGIYLLRVDRTTTKFTV